METGVESVLMPIENLGTDAIAKAEADLEKAEENLRDWKTVTPRRTKKRWAVEVTEAREKVAYLKGLFARFHEARSTGRYEWTPEERSQIQSLVEKLQADEYDRWNQRSFVEGAIRAGRHTERCIEDWRRPFGRVENQTISEYGQQVIAKLTMEQAARMEAFKIAGI